ncbi:exonuclease mut-7 homolog [Amphiura filiformis]|uniref:exonuclease mut-7 homolog n=1 Tax=Amphiura filiformis TaxID=82378 RepID=UPI003B21ED76
MAGASSPAGSVYMHPTHGGPNSPQQCLFNLETCWINKDIAALNHTLDQVFYTSDPRSLHGFILQILEGSHDMHRKKPDSMALVVLKQFEHWCNTHPHIMTQQVISTALTEDMKHEAFSISTNAHANIFDLLCRLYRLDKSGNEFLVPYVKSLLDKNQYKEAAQYATKLQLQNYFTLEEICLPLLLQDKINLAENYVKGNETMQIGLVQSLDQYCYKGFDAGQFLSELKIPNARKDKLRPQNLSKLIMRLVKLFKLDPEVCPNTCHTKDYGAMKFLLYKKYKQKSIEGDNWDELMVNTIRNNIDLQEELVVQLMCYNDLPAAAEWSQRFDIPVQKLPAAVISERERLQEEASNKPVEDETDDWDDELFTDADMTYPSEEYYRLSLPMDKVHMISTYDDLHMCQDSIVKCGITVGIDMEWRPTFTPTQVSRVMLVQLATYDNIYLLDMIALHDAGQPEVIKAFFTALFCGKEVLKLGFGIKTDLQMLHKSYPYLRECVSQLRRMVDLHTLSRQIVYALPDIMGEKAPASEAESVAAEKGLRELVHQCLGKPLDKKEQLSDWERRPLRPTQIHYSALDAYCLLEVYDLLKERVKAAELEINMEPSLSSKAPNICNPPKSSRSANRKAEREKKKNNSESPNSSKASSSPPLKPGNVAVVCDNMLQGLGRYLRACGIDVKILSNEDDHDVAAKVNFLCHSFVRFT